MGSSGFWQELRRRRVCRVAAAKVVVGWVLIQASTQVCPKFHLPGWIDQIMVMIPVGFPTRNDPRFQALLEKCAAAQAVATSAAGP